MKPTYEQLENELRGMVAQAGLYERLAEQLRAKLDATTPAPPASAEAGERDEYRMLEVLDFGLYDCEQAPEHAYSHIRWLLEQLQAARQQATRATEEAEGAGERVAAFAAVVQQPIQRDEYASADYNDGYGTAMDDVWVLLAQHLPEHLAPTQIPPTTTPKAREAGGEEGAIVSEWITLKNPLGSHDG